MKEIITIDENGFCTNGKYFFNIRDIKSVDKTDDDSITLGFFAAQRKITWEENSDRDKFWKIFTDKMIEIKEKERDHSDFHHNFMEAQLATQKSILGSNIGVIK